MYLDGREYHASVEHDRTADDARKRDALRAAGYRVWSLTWDDVADFERVVDGRPSQLETLVHENARNSARAAIGDPRAEGLWGNSMTALMAYLRDPQDDVWERTAVQTMMALTSSPEHAVASPVPVRPVNLSRALQDWASDHELSGSVGNTVIARCNGRSGLPIAVVGDISGGLRDALASVGALIVLDDRENAVGSPEHQQKWRDWLRWSNLVQFLTIPRYGSTPLRRMAEVWTRSTLDEFAGRTPPLAQAEHALPVTVDLIETGWDVVVEFAKEPASGLARRLASAGVPVPEVGAEVGAGEIWQVELMWPKDDVVVVVDTDRVRDEWLRQQGYRIFNVDGPDLVEQAMADITEALGGSR